jgi:hypothetical protein
MFRKISLLAAAGLLAATFGIAQAQTPGSGDVNPGSMKGGNEPTGAGKGSNPDQGKPGTTGNMKAPATTGAGGTMNAPAKSDSSPSTAPGAIGADDKNKKQ